jgi:hypothetical protein
MTPTDTLNLRKLIETTPELSELGQDYPAIAAALNARPMIENPTARQIVPKTFTINDVFHAITPVEALELYKIPNFRQDVERALAQHDMTGIQNYMMIASSLLSPESLGKLGTLMVATEDDPNWQATIAGDSIAMVNGWGRVTEHDVQAALT